MALSAKQKGVLVRMALGLFASLLVVLSCAYTNPLGYEDSLTAIDRLSVALASCLIPASVLAISIGCMARQRFFSPEDIDGGHLMKESEQAKILQSLLQNTMEQALLAVIVYCAWSILMPASWLSVVPVVAICFGVGRVLFFVSYSRGAVARAFSFTLSFYPSLIMLICIFGILLLQ